MKDNTELFALYQDYMQELWGYTNTAPEEQLKNLPDWWHDLTHNDRIKLHKLYHGTQPVGFLFIEELKPDDRDYTGVRWYINEAYVTPEERGKGLMVHLLDAVLEEPGKFGLHVIRNNIPAEDFWKSYFHKNGYRCELLPVMEGYEHCNFYKFSRP